jgi:hypothetical protein
VHRGKVFGRCEPTTGIEPFGRLVFQVMATEPYASARRVFWVVDKRQQPPRPTCRRTHGDALAQGPPRAASRARLLAQPGGDLFLRRAAQGPHPPNDFADLAEVESRLLAFERRYEDTATPFEWKFSRSDLGKLMERLADKSDYRAAA